MLLVTLIERLTRCGGSHSTQPAPCADWISGIKCIPAHPLAKASFANHWRTFLEILLAVFFVAALLVVKPKEPFGGTKHRRILWFAALDIRELDSCPGHKFPQR